MWRRASAHCALHLFMLCCCIFSLWPHPGRLKPPARCAPLAGKRSRFSDDLTWGERRWSSICPRRKTESWTAKPVKQRQAELQENAGVTSVNSTAAMAWRIHSCLISMESRSQGVFISCRGMMLFLRPSVADLYKWCPSPASKYPAVGARPYRRLVSTNDHISDSLW